MKRDTAETPFFADGLKFSCTRCSSCCRYEPGFVFLSQVDLALLVKGLQMGYTETMKTYCRWVKAGGDLEWLSLKEKSGYDCIFWQGGCSVYEYRPLQCRAFPFWHSNLASPEAWEAAAAFCPGMGKGEVHTASVIHNWLAHRRAEPPITRKAKSPGGEC
ncbi:MAG: YkgJ family cysteine cluster protein [Treponema sp.]|jgi:Fe-S-cluster containining protein|nr:YkgJ family cysteine cluster protein [Treponema sp.]